MPAASPSANAHRLKRFQHIFAGLSSSFEVRRRAEVHEADHQGPETRPVVWGVSQLERRDGSLSLGSAPALFDRPIAVKWPRPDVIGCSRGGAIRRSNTIETQLV
jgi:hypothetical protein